MCQPVIYIDAVKPYFVGLWRNWSDLVTVGNVEPAMKIAMLSFKPVGTEEVTELNWKLQVGGHHANTSHKILAEQSKCVTSAFPKASLAYIC